MHRPYVFVLIAMLATSCGGSSPTSPSSSTGNIAGAWTGTAVSRVLGNAQLTIGATFTQSGTNVSGAYTCSPSGAVPCAFTSGTITGTMTGNSLTGRVQSNSGIACDSFNGTLSTAGLSGTYACSNGDAGTWTMTKK